MKALVISLKMLLLMTLLTGVIYPLFITGVAQLAFARQANGSLIYRDHVAVGSELIGQSFDSRIYFQSRPSAVSYNALPSGASNECLTNSKLKEQVVQRKQQFISFNHLTPGTRIPAEMIFASGSGLDPHITYEAAILQVERIAEARHLSVSGKEEVIRLVRKMTAKPQFLFLGEERVNVFLLNLSLDTLCNRK